jgi:hypothetical protein
MPIYIFPQSPVKPKLILDAVCIDATFGGVYAWTFLAKAGLDHCEILELLSEQRSELLELDEVSSRAEKAMSSVGLRFNTRSEANRPSPSLD